jgi:hypothetical protein
MILLVAGKEAMMDVPASTAASSSSPDLADAFARLRSHLRTVPDHRHRRGMVHPLTGVLGLTVLGLMAGCRNLSAIHRYGDRHPEILPPLGLRRVPSIPTLSRVLGGINPVELRTALRTFTQEFAQDHGLDLGVVALDGKTLRGVQEDATPAHVLHVFAHDAALVLDQTRCAGSLGEVQAADTWITTVAAQFPGLAVLTADALYADQNLCAAIVGQDFDFLLRLKKTKVPSAPTPNSSLPTRRAHRRPNR